MAPRGRLCHHAWDRLVSTTPGFVKWTPLHLHMKICCLGMARQPAGGIPVRGTWPGRLEQVSEQDDHLAPSFSVWGHESTGKLNKQNPISTGFGIRGTVAALKVRGMHEISRNCHCLLCSILLAHVRRLDFSRSLEKL